MGNPDPPVSAEKLVNEDRRARMRWRPHPLLRGNSSSRINLKNDMSPLVIAICRAVSTPHNSAIRMEHHVLLIVNHISTIHIN